jgi:hypothetical protein
MDQHAHRSHHPLICVNYFRIWTRRTYGCMQVLLRDDAVAKFFFSRSGLTYVYFITRKGVWNISRQSWREATVPREILSTGASKLKAWAMTHYLTVLTWSAASFDENQDKKNTTCFTYVDSELVELAGVHLLVPLQILVSWWLMIWSISLVRPDQSAVRVPSVSASMMQVP